MTTFPSRAYVICTTPRSGSTLLCKLLSATRIAGIPDSHFHSSSVERWLTVFGLDETPFASQEAALRAVFEAALAQGSANTGVFGLRMQRGSFDFFIKQVSVLSSEPSSDVKRIENVFGPTTFIHLSRKDRVGQAISRVRAEQTGLWHRHADGSELERLAPANKPYYDAEAIARHIDDLSALDAEWEQWFEQQKIAPLRIAYADLSAEPQKVLSQVLSAIGCDQSVAEHIEIPTAKLADRESDAWRQRFLSEVTGDFVGTSEADAVD